MQSRYTAVGLLIVLAPVIILALHYNNRRNEPFAASAGGAQQQLMAGHVASENEIREMMEYNKKRVVHDIISMTEPESRPGPYPAGK
jgi:hypothetical protein